MKTVKAFTLRELKEKHPEGYKRAHEDYVANFNEAGEIPWNNEIMASLKALIEKLGYEMREWQIGPWDQCSMKIDERNADNYCGIRAEEFIYKSLGGKKDIDRYSLTGMCFDGHFIQCLIGSVKRGLSLKGAIKRLASDAGEMMEKECDYAATEEYFDNESESTDRHYTSNGREVDLDVETDEPAGKAKGITCQRVV